jgi:hypothetical protein
MLEPAVEIVDACFEALDYLANTAHFVELDLQLVNLAEDGSEAGDFSVGHLHCVASAVVLHLGRRLGLLGELRACQHGHSARVIFLLPAYVLPSLLYRVHQTIKVGAERLQAGRIQE